MKKNILYIAIILITTSCSSLKLNLIQKYITDEIKSDNVKNKFLLKEKPTFENARSILINGYIMDRNPDTIMMSNIKKIIPPKNIILEWKTVEMQKLKFDTLIREDSLRFVKNKIKDVSNIYLYKISDVYYFKDNKRAFFNIIKARFAINGIIYNKVILYKKVGNDWVFEKEINTTNLY